MSGGWGRRLRRVGNAYPGLIALLAGASTVTAFAPFGLFPLPVLSLALLFWLWRDAGAREALRLGWLFGIGLFGVGVFWLHVSIDQFGNVGTPFAVLITSLFIAFIALLQGLSGALARWLGASGAPQYLLVFPTAWILFEWLRGWLLSGFPWLALGYSQVDSPLAGFAPLGGVYGTGWLLALSAGLLAWLFQAPRRRLLGVAALVVIWGVGALLQSWQWTHPRGEALSVSMIQPNIPQSLKWEPSMRVPTLQQYQRLTRAQLGRDLVIWPETAVPDFLHRVEADWLRPLVDEAARHSTRLLVGVPVLDRASGRYFNAASVLGEDAQTYYKRHLVPFGEYLPFKSLLGPLLNFMQIPMSDFAPGSERPLVHVGEHAVGMSICYEDAFGDEVMEALPEAAYLVNLSNDAWFGDSLAPHQHLQIARMRALETGRALLRATNTGISALIGPDGRLLAVSAAFEESVLSGEIQPMRGLTPFARLGHHALPALAVSLLAALALWVRLRGGRTVFDDA